MVIAAVFRQKPPQVRPSETVVKIRNELARDSGCRVPRYFGQVAKSGLPEQGVSAFKERHVLTTESGQT